MVPLCEEKGACSSVPMQTMPSRGMVTQSIGVADAGWARTATVNTSEQIAQLFTTISKVGPLASADDLASLKPLSNFVCERK